MSSPLVEFKNVTLGYGRHVILRDLSFAIGDGEYVGFVGPNGAGKTTIVRAMLGTLAPRAGEIVRSGGAEAGAHLGYVPQRDSIDSVLPYSVTEVVLMGRYNRRGLIRHPGAADRAAADAALRDTGIAHLAGAAFKDLSGGQKQRTLIARALCAEPSLLILDEPTNGMDLASRSATLDLIQALHRERGMTVILVSHLLEDVAEHVKRIALVERERFQIGTVEEVLTGENLTAMYGVPIRVDRTGERMDIHAGGN